MFWTFAGKGTVGGNSKREAEIELIKQSMSECAGRMPDKSCLVLGIGYGIFYRLRDAGIETIGALQHAMKKVHWHGEVNGIGYKSANILVCKMLEFSLVDDSYKAVKEYKDRQECCRRISGQLKEAERTTRIFKRREVDYPLNILKDMNFPEMFCTEIDCSSLTEEQKLGVESLITATGALACWMKGAGLVPLHQKFCTIISGMGCPMQKLERSLTGRPGCNMCRHGGEGCLFVSLYHLINEQLLLECYWELDPDKATGIDEVDKELYGENDSGNIMGLILCKGYLLPDKKHLTSVRYRIIIVLCFWIEGEVLLLKESPIRNLAVYNQLWMELYPRAQLFARYLGARGYIPRKIWQMKMLAGIDGLYGSYAKHCGLPDRQKQIKYGMRHRRTGHRNDTAWQKAWPQSNGRCRVRPVIESYGTAAVP